MTSSAALCVKAFIACIGNAPLPRMKSFSASEACHARGVTSSAVKSIAFKVNRLSQDSWFYPVKPCVPCGKNVAFKEITLSFCVQRSVFCVLTMGLSFRNGSNNTLPNPDSLLRSKKPVLIVPGSSIPHQFPFMGTSSVCRIPILTA